MAKSFFTIDEISQIVNGKGASLLPKKEVKKEEPLADRDELLKMVFGGSILPSQTLQDSALQLDQALASNKALNGLRTATAVAGLVGDAAVEAVGIAEESYNNTYGENALAKKISEKPLKRLEKDAFGSEGKKKILAALGIDEEDTREVEVEGGEIIENEDGTTQKVEGPRHEQGGVDAMIDDDATVYSDRLQSLIGASKVEKTAKSIAEEKEKRDAKALSLQKKLEKNPNDRLLANTLALTLQQNMIADQMDLMWQQVARTGLEEQAGGKEQLMNAMFNKQEKQKFEEPEQEPETDSQQQEEAQEEEIEKPEKEEVNQEKLALGKERTKEKLLAGADPTTTPPVTTTQELTEEQKKAQEEAAKISLISEGVGNILGNQLYSTGAIISGLGGLNTTLQQRSEDILHENKYKGLARSVDKLYEQSISNISNVTNKRLQEMLNESQTTKQSIGNNFQSISNMAAYNAMLDDAVNKELAKIRGEELGAITGIQDARAKLLSTNMQKEMEGQAIAETLNDADRDAFYNALHLDYANIGTQMQAVASNMNKKYEDKTDLAKLLDEIENIGKDKKPQGEVQNTETDNKSNKEKEEQKPEQVPTPSGTTPPEPTQPTATNVATETPSQQPTQPTATNVATETPSQQPTQTVITNGKILEKLSYPELSDLIHFPLYNNLTENDKTMISKEIAKRLPAQENATKQSAQTEDDKAGAKTPPPEPTQQNTSNGETQPNEKETPPTTEELYEIIYKRYGLDRIFKDLGITQHPKQNQPEDDKAGAKTPPPQPTQTADANTGAGTTSTSSTQTEVPNTKEETSPQSTVPKKTQSNDKDQIKINGLYGILKELKELDIAQYLKPTQTEGDKAGAKTPSSSPTQSAATNAEEVTTSTSSTQQPATNTEVITPGIVTIKSFYKKDVSDLTEEELSTFLSFENDTIEKGGLVSNEDIIAAKKEKAKRDEEKKNEQNKKDAKEQVYVTNEDIENFTKEIEMIKKGEYKESYIPFRLDMYKNYMNSEINYPEGDISEDEKKQFTKTLSEAKKLMEKYNIDINSYIPRKKEEGEKYTVLFNSSGDAKSTFEGTIDEKQSKEITQDELLILIRNINKESDYFSESYVTLSFANVDIYDKERYPLSTLKAYRGSLDFLDSEKEFLDKLIERREFVDDAIKNGKIPVTENTLLKLDLARGAYMHWLNKNSTLQIDANDISYLGYISKDFIKEYEKNKDNLVFFNNKIETDFNYAIEEIKKLYEPNDTKLKEFKERMKKRNENIKRAEEQGQIIYEKKYRFYIDMSKINQHPIDFNAKENLIRLKKTITDIIDDYEKNKDNFYYPNDLGNNSEDGKKSHSKDIMSLKNKINQIEKTLKGFEQKEQTE